MKKILIILILCSLNVYSYNITFEDYTGKSYIRCCTGLSCETFNNKENKLLYTADNCYEVSNIDNLNVKSLVYDNFNLIAIGILTIVLVLGMIVYFKRKK